ncbi:histidine kinase [Methanoregula boonei 6A8]|uniref:histidine kinase n=1 Tax=Methanoregula boonei (strain DSM 21154 / JCM 14090 / 6A8) TaxID=456442 RepID=A7I6U2_METB6|nr:HAMP domain-containing sensor histidine kinase [Methanoregula boonei]ABS55453.1 histidine kinase [Methanoregula boonei 6A8]
MGPNKARMPEKGSAADPGAAVLAAIEQALHEGTAPEDYTGIADAATRQRLETVVSGILSSEQFALSMAEGNLSPDLAATGYLAGSLKALQSSLRHLTWQAGQIAGGDYSQRVRFMGEFSASFNSMTAQLAREAAERSRREQELRDTNEALSREIAEYQQLQRMLALTNRKLGLLSSVTRHDISNKLLALGAYIDLMHENVHQPEVLEGYLNSEAEILKIINGQIQFARDYEDIGIKEPVWNDLAAILAEAYTGLAFGNVRFDAAPGGAEIFADLLIAKVFYNLLDNALRYGGPAMTEIRITAEEGPDGLCVIVQDNGAGVAEEDKEQLFTRGFGKNTGFGLFLSREVLSLTGITIAEEGSPGSGARFRVTVPKGQYRFR